MPSSFLPPTVISGPLARKEAALHVTPASLTPLYLMALEEPLAKERKQEVDDLSQVLGPLEEHKGPWGFLPGYLVKATGLRKVPGLRVDPRSLKHSV